MRELKNEIERAVILNNAGQLDFVLGASPAAHQPADRPSPFLETVADVPTLSELEERYLRHIMERTEGRVRGPSGAETLLRMKRSTLYAKLKKYVAESIPVGILGVGEPLMYAVTLPLVCPFVTACLGAGFGGALAALLHIGTVSQGVSGLFGLLIVVPGQQLGYVAAMLLAYAAGFVLTWFFGVDEQKINEFFGE